MINNKYTAGLIEVIIYSSPDDKKKNRGFCFLEYESHKAASLAKRRLGTGRTKVCYIILMYITLITFINEITFEISLFSNLSYIKYISYE